MGKQAEQFHHGVQLCCKIHHRKCVEFPSLTPEVTRTALPSFSHPSCTQVCISDRTATPWKTQPCLQGCFFFFFLSLKVESCFQMQKTYGGFSCLFFQNANYQNNTLKHHFLLICQITIKSFLDAIILQDNKDYKQLPQPPIKKINIQLYDLRDLALDKVPFRSTLGNLFSLWKPYASPSKATCYLWHIFSSGVQKEKLCLPLSALFTLLPVI